MVSGCLRGKLGLGISSSLFCASNLLIGKSEFPNSSFLHSLNLSSKISQPPLVAIAFVVNPYPKSDFDIFYLNFKVVSAIIFAISAIIQNRTIILFSFQPFSSKW